MGSLKHSLWFGYEDACAMDGTLVLPKDPYGNKYMLHFSSWYDRRLKSHEDTNLPGWPNPTGKFSN